MAFALGEDGDQHIGARNLLAPRRLDVNDRTLNDALETGRRFGILVVAGDEIVEFGVEIVGDRPAQFVEIDIAGAHDGGRILVVDKRQEQVLKRCIFVVTLIGQSQSLMERAFEALRESRHVILTSSPSRTATGAGADGQNP